jgi:sugar O-acyltransferase (sialic acid O-acetyltransferase NeuD family)
MTNIIVLGGGGHAKVLIESLQLLGRNVIGFTDLDARPPILGVPCLGEDLKILSYSPEEILLVNGLGSTADNAKRKQIYQAFTRKGYRFASIIHPSAIISPNVELGEGVQVMAGVVIQAGTSIGNNTIINTRASVDHDTKIGEHVHIAPGVVLSGGITIQDEAHLGTGAVVIQGLTIGKRSIVGAGAVVIKDVLEGTKVAGVPAKLLDTD